MSTSSFDGDIADLQAHEAAEQAQIAADAAQLAADKATIAQQAAEIQQLQHPQPPTPPQQGIAWGSSVWPMPGETYAQALTRVEQQLQPQILRIYRPENVIPTWPTNTGAHVLNDSFKLLPSEVLAGQHDAALRAYFDATPRESYWTYWHECESAIKQGKFTAAEFRAAWSHIAAIARASKGAPLLKATLVLMGWSLTAQSGRNWRDYYPGDADVDVLAWDCYVWSATDSPATAFDLAHSTSVAAGKPWAVAECGAGAVQFPAAADRARILTALSAHLSAYPERPVFVEYFDSQPGGTTDPYKWPISTDPAAAAAWRAGQTA